MNLGAIMIFTRRSAQISAYLMLALNTVKIAGFNLGLWMWLAAGIVMVGYIIVDVVVIFPQEQDYSVRNSKTLMQGLNHWTRAQEE